MSYPLSAIVIAAYESTAGKSYSQLADTLNKEGIPPPKRKSWSRWAARGLCLSIGRPSVRHPKTDNRRLTINRALGRLIAVIPALAPKFTAIDLASASGMSLTTSYKYCPLIQAIHGGDIDPAKFTDHFDMWKYWRSVGTQDEEAAPV